jgi:RNA polymerase-binding transcription factor DksA
MKDTEKFKKKLEQELKLVEKELQKIGRKNPSRPDDWEPVEEEIDADHADDTDVADNQESFIEDKALMDKLEPQYKDIKLALEKIKKGNYGLCEVGGEAIPLERLEANPSARTCITHAKELKA